MQKKNTSNTKKLGLFGLVTVATLGATALANADGSKRRYSFSYC